MSQGECAPEQEAAVRLAVIIENEKTVDIYFFYQYFTLVSSSWTSRALWELATLELEFRDGTVGVLECYTYSAHDSADTTPGECKD